MTVKIHDVVQIIEESLADILRDKDPDNEIMMCEVEKTNKVGELITTFVNRDLSEDRYIISITPKE